jgi:hypothetical protein
MTTLPRAAPGAYGQWLPAPIALGAAAVVGALAGVQPLLALGLVSVAVVAALAFLAPVAHLTLLLLVTAIVPYDLQNAVGVSGGSSAGLIFSDLLLLTGLARATVVLLRRELYGRHLLAGAAIVTLLAVTGLQTLRALQLGVPVSLAGFEFRALLGWSTLLIAMPILMDAAGRRRLLKGLLVVGLGLGLWGLAQYFVNIPVIGGGSAGVRENVAFTAGARSIQGGLFGFPIAFVLGLAALSSAQRTSPLVRSALIAVVATNGASLLLTYQRTFWVATIVGFLFIVMKAGWSQKAKVVVLLVAALLSVLPLLAVLSPGSLVAAQQRFLSIGQYGSDNSVRTRIVETRAVARKIREAPIAGWGIGDEVSFGYPWLRVPPTSTPYTHNGYLWLAWKLGIPAALVLLALLAWALAARPPRGLDPMTSRVRHGAQAGLLIALTVSLTFPAFRALAITTTLGVLVALALMTPATGD